MSHHSVSRTLRLLLLMLPVAAVSMGADCGGKPLPLSGAQLYLSPQVQPMALSEDGTLLYVASTTSGLLSVLDVTNPLRPNYLAEIRVGHDPTSVAVLPGGVAGDELVFVVNHISDSISVVSRNKLGVIQTVHAHDAAGVTRMDEPTSIAFTSPSRALVTLDQPNQVVVLDVDANGHASIAPERVAITAQAPRAIAVGGGRAFVAAFESGNQTEFSSCWTGDTRGLLENDAARTDEGCEFETEIIDEAGGPGGPGGPAGLRLGSIFQFAAVNPNIGGRVIRDTDIPDRDLFVIDPNGTPSVVQVIDTVGTLLAGLAAHTGPAGTRLWVSHTEARNHLDGLGVIDNHMFENRVALVDCAAGGSCSLTGTVDLDASAAGIGHTVPNPWGIQASADGETVVVTAASADGDPGDGRPPLHGLFTLDRDGQVLGSALVGALPEGVVLRSGPGGAAQVAYVLNTADNSVSTVDVSNPQSPQTVGRPIVVGNDPTPAEIRLGRIAFHTARGSTSRTFACGSCHPNGNIDQLQWVINTVTGPDDGPNEKGEIAEPRTTMPIRGLRDTLPLHWEGTLGDPIAGVNPEAEPFDTAPDCDIEAVGEIGCVRHLVDAALSGPMCQHNVAGGCQPDEGQLGLAEPKAGSLTEAERDAMAAFQVAVSFPPAPDRRPDDVLSPLALAGVADFFTNEDDEGINDGIGQVLNFAPTTCADNPMGCHSLPLTHSTNSSVVGGFDAPGARGMWDRFTLFSNGIFSSEEVLRGAQDCADGIAPGEKFLTIAGLQVPVSGDPCNLLSPVISGLFGFSFADLPFPSGEHVYHYDEGFTERGSFVATFEGIFALVYGVRGDRIWQYQMEIGTGLPGLTGRQVSIDPADPNDPDTVAWMDRIEAAAQEGRVTGVATGRYIIEMRWDPEVQAWSLPSGWTRTGAELRALAEELGQVITVTADLPGNVSIGGADRQPLLDVDPDVRAAEVTGDQPTVPTPFEDEPASFRIGAEYVEPGASVLIDGVRCTDCSFVPAVAPTTGKNAIDVSFASGLPRGVHVMQVLNPDGWASNELPICVTNVGLGRPLPPIAEEACKVNLDERVVASNGCATVATDCACDGGAEGAVRECDFHPQGKACEMTLYCFGPGDCADATVAATCAP